MSGPVAVGKTTLVDWFVEHRGAELLYTPDVIRAALPADSDRSSLASAGDELAMATEGQYLVDAAVHHAVRTGASLVVFDAFRRVSETVAARATLRSALFHAHLVASPSVLEARYASRAVTSTGVAPATPYAALARHPGEAQVPRVGALADEVFDTDGMSPSDVAETVERSARRAWKEIR